MIITVDVVTPQAVASTRQAGTTTSSRWHKCYYSYVIWKPPLTSFVSRLFTSLLRVQPLASSSDDCERMMPLSWPVMRAASSRWLVLKSTTTTTTITHVYFGSNSRSPGLHVGMEATRKTYRYSTNEQKMRCIIHILFNGKGFRRLLVTIFFNTTHWHQNTVLAMILAMIFYTNHCRFCMWNQKQIVEFPEISNSKTFRKTFFVIEKFVIFWNTKKTYRRPWTCQADWQLFIILYCTVSSCSLFFFAVFGTCVVLCAAAGIWLPV